MEGGLGWDVALRAFCCCAGAVFVYHIPGWL